VTEKIKKVREIRNASVETLRLENVMVRETRERIKGENGNALIFISVFKIIYIYIYIYIYIKVT